jgi:exopolysaccharide biosynthesis WecB/TagA/CpsF family protein
MWLKLSHSRMPRHRQGAAGPNGSGPAPGTEQVDLGGMRVDLCSADTVRRLVADRLRHRHPAPLYVASANLDHVHHFGRRGEHRELLAANGAQWLVLADGRPVVAAARRATGRHWDRLAGADLLPELLDVAIDAGARVGFLGGTREMHARLRQELDRARPELVVAGYWAPLRAELTDPDQAAWLAEHILLTGVDLLVVCLGKPLQEQFLARHGERTGTRVGLAFGAAADFLAGTASRAPDPVQRAGLEWLFRLVHEPRRLGRRYLFHGPPALYDLFAGRAPAAHRRPEQGR